MSEITEQVGQLIREARKAKGMTLKDLAEKTGVSESTFSRYEAGKQSVSFEQAHKIANVLGLNLKVSFE
ncbi:helix-turn-helix domain-containing protein [Spirosoma sp. HMF4905]|uniref:Helix-turn-helix domain-containing protein n=1 Tax=Spirosoma arboris TaxID=2682092 RepID=A0A7K1SND4_9BACT|nr:helix-turn-helix transcriptional regulator [Spirosoma arboris]MVM35277.1 helix-turn-helix domain-containing protein [Spirosoma arboris]